MNNLLNSLVATYLTVNFLILLRMVRKTYFPTKNELKNYTEEEQKLDREGMLLFIPLTLTIGILPTILSYFDKEEK